MQEFKMIWDEIPRVWVITFFVCLLSSLTLMTVSFILPPQGIIDSSVFKACGFLLAYPALLTGFIMLLKGANVKYDLSKKTFEVNSKSHKNETASQEN